MGADESLRFVNGVETWPAEYYPTQALTVHHSAAASSRWLRMPQKSRAFCGSGIRRMYPSLAALRVPDFAGNASAMTNAQVDHVWLELGKPLKSTGVDI